MHRITSQPQVACIVLPTYNEAGNIQRHLNRIFEAVENSERTHATTYHVLVVDDNSPDGTARIVQAYRRHNPRVHLLLRKQKAGLGAAYTHGIQHALRTISPDVVYEMDSDGQHDPKDLLRLLDAIHAGADLAIGSRYIKGGSITRGWGLHRKLTSLCARAVTRTLLGLGRVKDVSGGYRAFRADALRKVDWPALRVKGYAFQAVLLEEIIFNKGIVTEVPIEFGTRESGASKMRVQDMIEGFLICARVRSKRVFNIGVRRKEAPSDI